MAQTHRIKSEPLGIAITFKSDRDVTEKDVYDVLKTQVTPQKMLEAYSYGHEDLAIGALRNGFFEEDGPGFWSSAETVLSDLGEGIGETFTTSAWQDERLRLAGNKFGPPVKPDQFTDVEKRGITESAKQLLGLSRRKRPRDEFEFTQADAFVPEQRMLDSAQFDKDLSQAMQFGGLDPMDNVLKRQVIGEASRLNQSQAAASRGKGAAEAMGGLYMLGGKARQWGREAGATVSGGATERGDDKIHLDYLVEKYAAIDFMEDGAAKAAESGGALAFVAESMMLPVSADPDIETYNDIRSRAVEPDPETALAFSMISSPDVYLTGGLAAGVMAPGRFIARGAIAKAARKVEELAAKRAGFRAAIRELEELQILKGESGAVTGLSASQVKRLNLTKSKLAEVNKQFVTESEHLRKLSKRSSVAAASVAQTVDDPALRRAILSAGKPPKAPLVNQALGQTLRAAGVPIEYVGRLAEYLRRLPEEHLTNLFMRTSGVDEAVARGWSNAVTTASITGGGLAAFTDLGSEVPGLGEALALLLLSKNGARLVTRMGKDVGILGKQLTYAQTSIPYFARIGALPDETASFLEVTLDRSSALTFGETTSQLARILSPKREFGPSPVLRATSTGLAQTGVGQTMQGVGRFLGESAQASVLPGAIGYAIGGPEGAGAAIGISAPFLAAGVGFSSLHRYATKSDIAARNMGDLAYYKSELLPESERATFDLFDKPVQQMLATYSLQHPDVVIEIREGAKGSNWNVTADNQSVVTLYNKDPRAPHVLAAHEFGHHVDFHGFTPVVIETLLGSYEKGKTGVFTKFDKEGKPVVVENANGDKTYAYNEEFAKHRRRYLDKLDRSEGVSNRDKIRYQEDPGLIAREIFAEHYAEEVLTGGNVSAAYRGAGSKMIRGLAKSLGGRASVKRLAHKLGFASDSNGIIFGTGLFKNLRKIPALEKMVRQYNAETLGFGKKARQEGRGRGRMMDSDYADEYAKVVLNAKDVSSPEAVQKLKAGGHLATNDDGTVQVDAAGRPIFIPTRQVNKNNRQLSEDILSELRKREAAGEVTPEGHLTLEKTADGGERATGRFIDESIIDNLAKSGRYSAAQIEMLRKINASLRDQDGGVFSLFYYAALGWSKFGRKVYKSIKGGERTSLPFGITVTKKGNVNVETVSLEAFRNNLEWWAKNRPEAMAEAFGVNNETAAIKAAQDLLATYLQNHLKGVENGTPESGVSVAQRDIINAAIGRINKEQLAANPRLEGLGDKLSQRLQSYRSRRLDRIGDAYQVSDGMPVTPRAIEQNLRPMYLPEVPADSPLGLRDNIREDVLPSIKQDKLSPGQFKAALGKTAGAKAYAEEIGLLDFLDGKKSVTKAEIDSYVAKNAPRLEEKVLGKTRPAIDEVTDPFPKYTTDLTKFSEYQEPGGTNYREVLIKLPIKDNPVNRRFDQISQELFGLDYSQIGTDGLGRDMLPYEAARARLEVKRRYQEEHGEPGAYAEKSREVYYETHFDEDNVLLHLRLNDRIDADGKKVMFVEELQSQWHQKGRKKGYRGDGDNYKVVERDGKFFVYNKSLRRFHEEPFEVRRFAEELAAIKNEKPLTERIDDARVPDAPFKKNWPALGLKRAIREALENGYDRVAWLDGEGQAARYDLSKHVDSIVHMKNKDGTYDLEVISDNSVEVSKNNQTPRQLEELVGKEVAQKITEGKGGKPDDYPGGWKELSGLDLKVGGEGMKAFYDRELVSIANKISKKIGGGKVRREKLDVILEPREITDPFGEGIFVGSHVLDLPKNPQAVENLRLYMPAEKAPSDSTPPELIFEKDPKGQTTLPFAKTPREETEFARLWNEDAEKTGAPKVGTGEIPDPPKGWQAGTPRETRGAFDPRSPGRMFMPASEAGATKGKQAEAAKLWQEKGTDSPYFKKYSGGAKIVKIGEQHDFVSGEPVVVEGVHGSTHTFKEFDPSKANPESDLGKAIYISNTPDEVAVNYAGEGPDLTGRIERKAETYMGMVEDELSSYGLSEDATQQQIEAKSYELARNELVGEGPQIYRVFAKFKNPVVVREKFTSIDDFRNRGGKKETNFELMFDEDAGTESGTLVDLLEQVDEVAYDFEFVDVDKVKSDIMEAADYESIGAQELIETMKESEGLMDTMDADGEFANGEFVRQVFEGMGFDGIIDLSVNEKFGSQRKMGQSMEGMNPDTIHYLAFKPEQIKSATGNRGTFDVGERNMLYMPAAPEDASPNTVSSWGDGDSPSFPAGYRRGQAPSNEEVAKLFQEKYVERYGEPIDPYDYGPETLDWLADMIASEGEAALQRTGSAVDWYTTAVERAMSIAEEIFPEIKTSKQAKDRFLGALAITSQNMRVLDNAKAAVYQYEYKAKHGKFDYEIDHGGKAPAITKNLRAFDKMESGMTDFHGFLDTDFTVRELTQFGKKFFGDEKFAIDGRMDDVVKGSAVFGPKIGQGFFQNLKGNYDPVTIDLWLRRTFGRLTGRSVDVSLSPQAIGRLIYSHRKNTGRRKTDFELPEFLRGLKISGSIAKDGKMNFKISDKTFERLFGEHEKGAANADAVFKLAGRLSKEWERRFAAAGRSVTKAKADLQARKKAGRPTKQASARLSKAEAEKAKIQAEKPYWAYAATSISGKLKPIDIPTPQERTVIVQAFHKALAKLRERGYDLTPADLQATLWYPEKDIWSFLKGDKADALNMSYDQAMEKIRDAR